MMLVPRGMAPVCAIRNARISRGARRCRSWPVGNPSTSGSVQIPIASIVDPLGGVTSAGTPNALNEASRASARRELTSMTA
jgi:hypothetical protein